MPTRPATKLTILGRREIESEDADDGPDLIKQAVELTIRSMVKLTTRRTLEPMTKSNVNCGRQDRKDRQEGQKPRNERKTCEGGCLKRWERRESNESMRGRDKRILLVVL